MYVAERARLWTLWGGVISVEPWVEGGGEGTHALEALSAGDVIWMLKITERGMGMTHSTWDPRRYIRRPPTV